jgi:signal transduction histidine kinase
MPGDDRPPTVPGVERLSPGNRTQSATDGADIVLGPAGRIAGQLRTGLGGWFEAGTWQATMHLALWLVMSWISAAITLAGLLVSLLTERVGGLRTAVRGSVTRLLAATVRADLQRIESYSGVRIQPLALPRIDRGASMLDRRQALERAPLLWRLPAYELVSASVVTALTAGAVAWWWGTLGCLALVTKGQGSIYQYFPLHVFGLTYGPVSHSVFHEVGLGLGAIVGVLMWPAAVRAVSTIDVAVARWLLGPSTNELSREVDRLSETRSQAVAAADGERRRIERDLHDGFQPQLVNLALLLGLAKSRLASDPDAARVLLDRAHDDAKRANADLRNLVRGIHPSVLDERGLDAAFSALAASSAVHVQIDVHLDRRPPREPEGIAYFVVAEAITNINKHAHAHAQTATITVSEIDGSLRVLVQDDGQGGARPEPGGGLAGLGARIAGVDGTFSITSPEGGPTWIEARIPCAW